MSQMQNRISRRSILAVLGAASGAIVLSACAATPATPTAAPKPQSGAASTKPTGAAPQAAAPNTAGKQVTLDLAFPGWIIDVNPIINKLSEEYASSNGVKINIVKTPPDFTQKVMLEAQQKKSSWAGAEGYAAFATVATWEAADAIVPWDGHLTKDDLDDLWPTARQEMSYKGKMWLFPYRVSPIGIGWRPNIYKEVGLGDKPPTTWDQFFENAQRIEKAKSTPDKRFFGNTMHLEPRYVLYSIMQSMMSDPYDYDRGLANLDKPEVPEAFELVKRLASFSPPDSLPSWNDSMNITNTGQMGQIVNHLLTMFRAKKPLNGDMLTAALPVIKQSRTNYWSSGPMIMKHGGKVEETAKFWLWLSRQKALYDEMWVVNGSPPNRISLLTQFEPMKGKELDAGIWDVIAQQEKSPPMPNSLWFGIQHDATFTTLQDYVAGKVGTAKEAIAAINKKTDEQIAKQKK